ncbi:MAG: TRAP transporter small permease subunit [Pseudomonadota bacterium]
MTAIDPSLRLGRAGGNDATDRFVRFFAWANLFLLGMFLFQTVLVVILGFEGPSAALGGEGGPAAWLLLLFYPAAVIAAWFFVSGTPLRGLREDSDKISGFNAWIVRGAFFAVLFVGVVDFAISFLRVEEMLPGLLGEDLAGQMNRSLFRGPYVHLPLVALGFVLALFARGPGFTWLALMIVGAELLIVISRFVFSYEQAFMGDLVRFWYAALFLFASAYTLLDEGHVRVDVFYAAMDLRRKGWVNTIGAVLFGLSLCWVILLLGMNSGAATIMAPLMKFEVTQTGFGLFVKYLMAGFLGIFAITMLIQFCAMLMESVADIKGEPGHRDRDGAAAS